MRRVTFPFFGTELRILSHSSSDIQAPEAVNTGVLYNSLMNLHSSLERKIVA